MASVHGPLSTSHPQPPPSSNSSRASRSTYQQQPQSSASSAASSHAVSKEAYYGHEYMSKLGARFITHLFACPEYPPGSNPNSRHEQTRLPLFIAYALHRTKLHPSVTFAALVLLQRLKARFPTARGSSGHRLFISAYMIASKVICDDTYSNKSWSIVAQGMFTLREINQMEREMCNYLDWELTVDNGILSNFETMIKRDFRGAPPYPTYSLKMVSRRATKAEEPATAAAVEGRSSSASKSSTPEPVIPYTETSSPIPAFSQGSTQSPIKPGSQPTPPLSAPRHSARYPNELPPSYPSSAASVVSVRTQFTSPHSHPQQQQQQQAQHRSSSHKSSASPITPDTPSPSHSISTSPASSIAPRTPQDEFGVKIAVVSASPALKRSEKMPVVPSAKAKMFAYAAPTAW